MTTTSASRRYRVGIASVLLATTPVAQATAEEMLFRCNFDWMCDPNRICQDAALDIRFKLDADSNTATRVGAVGPGRTDVVIGDRAVTFVETPISAGLSTTTIKLDTGQAVHSSHTIDGVDLNPAQYLGECVVF